ncbi:MAG: hypothetical protein LBF91_02105, partial [Azoarcus sp.]|nr:hypothetical protein [Azoarcus sp.]
MARRSYPDRGRAGHARDGNPFAALKALNPKKPRPGRPSGDDDAPGALFRHAIDGTLPLPDSGRAETSAPLPPPEPRQHQMDEAATLRESLATPL